MKRRKIWKKLFAGVLASALVSTSLPVMQGMTGTGEALLAADLNGDNPAYQAYVSSGSGILTQCSSDRKFGTGRESFQSEQWTSGELQGWHNPNAMSDALKLTENPLTIHFDAKTFYKTNEERLFGDNEPLIVVYSSSDGANYAGPKDLEALWDSKKMAELAMVRTDGFIIRNTSEWGVIGSEWNPAALGPGTLGEGWEVTSDTCPWGNDTPYETFREWCLSHNAGIEGEIVAYLENNCAVIQVTYGGFTFTTKIPVFQTKYWLGDTTLSDVKENGVYICLSSSNAGYGDMSTDLFDIRYSDPESTDKGAYTVTITGKGDLSTYLLTIRS